MIHLTTEEVPMGLVKSSPDEIHQSLAHACADGGDRPREHEKYGTLVVRRRRREATRLPQLRRAAKPHHDSETNAHHMTREQVTAQQLVKRVHAPCEHHHDEQEPGRDELEEQIIQAVDHGTLLRSYQ